MKALDIEPGMVLCDMHDGLKHLNIDEPHEVVSHIRISLHGQDVGSADFIERLVSAARGEPWSPYCNKLLTVVGYNYIQDGRLALQAMYSYDFSTLGVVEILVREGG